MLVLTRKVGESIRIGDEIEVVVTAVDQNKVRIGVKSPRNIPVYREELYRRIQQENQQAANVAMNDLDEMLKIVKTPESSESATSERPKTQTHAISS
ncbi:MAG: carbon storage regulator CsrA [Syntrophobacteraceae bacterium]